MKKQADEMKDAEVPMSEWLSEFLQGMEQTPKDYEWAQEETRLEKLTQDYLHLLELSDLNYHDRAKIAGKLKDCRIERRAAKDMIMVLEPVTEFLTSERGKMLISQMQQVLGKVRKAEKYIEQRSYTPKVLSQRDYETCVGATV